MATKEWRRKNEGYLVKIKIHLSAGKVPATIFVYYREILLIDFLRDQHTVNAAYYYQKCHSPSCYARPHTAALTRNLLEGKGWETFEYPLSRHKEGCSLSPCDYSSFALMKESQERKRFESNEEVEE